MAEKPTSSEDTTTSDERQESFWKRNNLWAYALIFLAIIAYVMLDHSFMRAKNAPPTPPPAAQEQAAADEPTGDNTAAEPAKFDGEIGADAPTDAKAAPSGDEIKTQKAVKAIMHTSKGDITLKFFPEDAPKTVANFVKLSKDGFYDGLIFHRVIKDFMLQAGCPKGDGTGGPGYTFEDEFNDHKIVRGALAMANSGPNTNGSQFFIVTADACPWLDGKHTVFGEVEDGMKVVDAIEAAPTGAMDRPIDRITINSVDIIE